MAKRTEKSLSAAGKKGKACSPWGRGPNVREPRNWARLKKWKKEEGDG